RGGVEPCEDPFAARAGLACPVPVLPSEMEEPESYDSGIVCGMPAAEPMPMPYADDEEEAECPPAACGCETWFWKALRLAGLAHLMPIKYELLPMPATDDDEGELLPMPAMDEEEEGQEQGTENPEAPGQTGCHGGSSYHHQHQGCPYMGCPYPYHRV